MTQADVVAWVALMRQQGIKKLSINGLCLEIGGPSSSYSAQEAPVATQGAFEESTGSICSCGHSWATEHVKDGCLLGCSFDLCSSTGGIVNE
jgi:hypothetical protein